MSRTKRAAQSVALILLATAGLASSSEDQIADAMISAAYVRAEALATELARKQPSPRNLSMLGDARFMQDNSEAHLIYAQAWLGDLKRAWNSTKGDSPAWKAFAFGVAALGVAADVVNAKQGITSSHSAETFEASSEILGSLDEATGNKDSRKNVKRVIGDLNKLVRKNASSYRIIRPDSPFVAGAGMARVHTSQGVCNSVRVGIGMYVVSSSCLVRFGPPVGVSIRTTLEPHDFAPVAFINDAAGWSTISTEAGRKHVSTLTWRPIHAWPTSSDTWLTSSETPTSFGATWYAPEFDYLIPVFESCSSIRFDDCGDLHENNALLWTRSTGAWKFFGFAAENGKIIHYDEKKML